MLNEKENICTVQTFISFTTNRIIMVVYLKSFRGTISSKELAVLMHDIALAAAADNFIERKYVRGQEARPILSRTFPARY